MINEPLIICEDYGAVYHQTSIDPLSDHARAMQSAYLQGSVATMFGTFKKPDVEREECQRFWDRFKQELIARGIVYAHAWVKRHLSHHHVDFYGVHLTGKVKDHPDIGELVEVAIDLTKGMV